jgi:hypothetical protein
MLISSSGEAEIPLDNLWIPHRSINRQYHDRIQYYQENIEFKKPTGVAETDYYNSQYFNGWVKLTKRKYLPDYPKVYVTDGVHRVLALEKNGVKIIPMLITDRP